MRKFYLFVAALAGSMLLFSCSKEIEQTTEPSSEEGFEYIFRISDESNDPTRTTIDGSTVKWETGDKIGIFAQGSVNKYGTISTLDPVKFPVYLSNALQVGDKVYCYYPYNKDDNDSKTASTVVLKIPASQTGDFDAMPQVSLPYTASADMASGTNNVDDLYFCNLGSIARFLVYSSTGVYKDETISSIKFTANTALAGDFSFDLTAVDYATPTTLAISGLSSLTAETSASAAIGTSTSNAGVVNLVIAPGSYSGTIVLTTNKATYTYTISDANKITFNRSKAKRIGLDLESANCTREKNGYDIPVTINFKDDTNTEYVEITGADHYNSNSSYFYGSTLRFDATGEQIVIPTKAAFGDISIVALYNTSSTPTSKLEVYGSADGSSYTLIGTPSFTHEANATAAPDAVVITNTESSYRYIKMVFTFGTGKLAVGSISLAAPDTAPRITATDISDVAAVGVADAPAVYTVYNFVDDVTVTSVTGCVSEALALDGDIVYTVTPNYTGAERSGTIVLASTANPSVTKTINVTQDADVFSVSTTSVTVGKAAGSVETFTVTSTYGFTVVSSDEDAVTVSPANGSGSANPQTITVTAVTANDGAEKLLGTVTVTRTVDDNDELEVAVNQQTGEGGKVEQTLFHETFGNNTGSARAWDDSYSVKSGVSAVYSGITSYGVTNAKQGKNTTGYDQSGLNQSSQGTDAILIIGPLNVATAEEMVLTYQWKAVSIKGTYTTKLYYSTSSDGTYTEVSGTGAGATSFVERSYALPAAAQVSTLYLKIVWNTSNTQAIIDEVNLNGLY